MKRVQQLVAWLGIAFAIAGVPVVLAATLGSPASWTPPVGGWHTLFTSAVSATTMVVTMASIAWVAWAVFALALIVELVNAATGLRVRLPGLGGPQQVARRLVAAAMLSLVVGAPGIANASTLAELPGTNASLAYSVAVSATEAPLLEAGPTDAGETAATPADAAEDSAEDTADVQAPRAAQSLEESQADEAARIAELPRYTVEAPEHGEYDCLWDIAERHLGDPLRWKEIHHLNTGPQAQNPVADPDVIYPGQELIMPADATDLPGDKAPEPAPAHAPVMPDTAKKSWIVPDTVDELLFSVATSPILGQRLEPVPDEPAAQTVEQQAPAEAPAEQTPATVTPSPSVLSQVGDGAVSALGVVADNPRTSSIVAACGIGGVLAAGLAGAVSRRRAEQRRGREPGQRIALPAGDAAVVEQQLRCSEPAVSTEVVDSLLLGLAEKLRIVGRPFPQLHGMHVGHSQVSLFTGAVSQPVDPWEASDDEPLVWTRPVPDPRDVPFVPRDAADRPYPGLLTVGQDEAGGMVIIDAASVGAFAYTGPDEVTRAAASAAATELLTGPWSAACRVTTVGLDDLDVPFVCDDSRYEVADDIWAAMRRLRTHVQAVSDALAHVECASVGEARAMDKAPDAWGVEVLVVCGELDEDARAELSALALGEYGEGVAVITAGMEPLGPWCVAFEDDAELPTRATDGEALQPLSATFMPAGTRVWPQVVTEELLGHVRTILETTAAPMEPGPQWAQSVRALPTSIPHLAESTLLESAHPPVLSSVPQPVGQICVRVLGPVQVAGAPGPVPRTAGHDHEAACTELLSLLVLAGEPVDAEYARSLLRSSRGGWSEKTLRTRVAQLRTWLAADGDDAPVIVERDGSYEITAEVGSDWDDFLDVVGNDVAQASVNQLLRALRVVRGKPFDGLRGARYQWAHAYALEMMQSIVDVAHECATRALEAGEVAAAREATQIGLAVDPQCDAMWLHLLRVESAARDISAMERAVARYLDLCDEHDREPGEVVVEMMEQIRESREQAAMAS